MLCQDQENFKIEGCLQKISGWRGYGRVIWSLLKKDISVLIYIWLEDLQSKQRNIAKSCRLTMWVLRISRASIGST